MISRAKCGPNMSMNDVHVKFIIFARCSVQLLIMRVIILSRNRVNFLPRSSRYSADYMIETKNQIALHEDSVT